MTREPAPVRDEEIWRSSYGTSTNRSRSGNRELRAEDKTEMEQDLALLKTNPGIPELLKIAHRRLRSCSDSAIPTK